MNTTQSNLPKMSYIIYSKQTGIVYQKMILTHYSLFDIHDMVDKYMGLYHKEIKEVIAKTKPGAITNSVPELEEPPMYLAVGNKTIYTSMYAYHKFVVDVNRNAENYIEFTATILPNNTENANTNHYEIQYEKEIIQEIVFVRLLKHIQLYCNRLQELEEDAEHAVQCEKYMMYASSWCI